MNLLTFAHRAEAQAFFKHFKYTPTEIQTLFEASDHYLLLTGEGPLEAATSVSFVLGKYSNIETIFNFGVAGVLGDLELNQLVEVRHAYLYSHNRPDFKSFPVGEGRFDIVTSGDRILSLIEAAKLAPMGDLVDREVWGIGFAAKANKLKLRSFKYLSDKAGELGACELVQNKAQEASERFLKSYLECVEKVERPEKIPGVNLESFYFTTSMKREMDKLFERLKIKYQVDQDKLIQDFFLKFSSLENESPKQRAKLILQELRKMADPEYFQILDRLNEISSNFEKKGIKVNFDPSLENEDLNVQFKANKTNMKEILINLEAFPWNDFEKIMKGEI